jgi:hypothetical protein
MDVTVLEFPCGVSEEFLTQLKSKQVRLWFYFSLVYLDFMQTSHEAHFCWEIYMDPEGRERFTADPTPTYNLKT